MTAEGLEDRTDCEYLARAKSMMKAIKKSLDTEVYNLVGSNGVDYLVCYKENSCNKCTYYKPKEVKEDGKDNN